MSLSYGRTPTIDTVLHATGGDIQKIYNLVGVPEFIKVAAAMTARRYHDAVQGSANPNPPTIAAQAFGNPPGVPVGAAGAPPAPAGGLGATPQAAPQMSAPAPEAGMAAPAPEAAAPQEAPMGMAEGGIAGLDIPDTMYDEPSNGGFNDGYAGGGLVAFAGGSPGKQMTDAEYLAYIMRKESGGRDYDKNGRPLTSKAGAKYAMQVLDSTARAPGYGVAPAKSDSPEEYNRVGRELALAWRKKFGDTGGAAAYNMGPGAYQAYASGQRNMPNETRNYIAGLGGAPAPAAAGLGATAPAGTFEERTPDILGGAERFRTALSGTAKPETKRRDALIAKLEAEQAPEAIEKARKQNMWAAVTAIGANIATNPGGLIAGAMQGVKEELPKLLEGNARDKAAARANYEMLARLEDKSNEEKQKIEELALEMALKEQGLLSDERKLRLQYELAKMDDVTKRAIAQASNYAQVYSTVYTNSLNNRADLRKTILSNQSNERVAGVRAAAAGNGLFEPKPATGAGASNQLDFNQLD